MNGKRWIAVAAILALALVGAWWWRSRAAGAAPKYRTAEVDRGSIESVVSATGTIRPVVQVEIGSQVSGTVDKLFADYNSRVKAGQVILQLEQSSFRARVVQAEAAVARAEASVKDAERALARAKELFAKEYVSQADLDAAAVAVDLRQADLRQARAQLESAEVDLAHATIRSPIDGVVVSRSIDLGQTVAASLQAPKLFVIANDLSQMQVESGIDEADIGRIRNGLPVTFTVDAFPERTFTGQVAQVRLEPIVDQGVVSYITVIHTRNPDLQLRPGMTANVTVLIERREDVMRVPNAALRFRPPMAPGARGGQSGAMAATAGGAAGAARERGGNGGEARAATAGDAPGAGRADLAGARGPGGRTADSSAAGMRRGGRRSRGGDQGADLTGREPAGRDGRGMRAMPEAGASGGPMEPGGKPDGFRPGAVYLLANGKPERLMVLTGITDGQFTEVRSDRLKPGDKLIVGTETPARANTLQPPPGMGGPQFRGPGGGGRR